MTYSFFIWLSASLLLIGFGALLFVGLETLVLSIYGLWIRQGKHIYGTLQQLRGVEAETNDTFSSQDSRKKLSLRAEDLVGLAVLIGILLARDVLLTALIIGAGVAVWAWLRRARRQRYEDRLIADLEIVLVQLKARIPATHSISRSLVAAQKHLPPFSPLRSPLAEVAHRLEMQQSPQEACRPLRTSSNHLVRRLSNAIAWSAETSEYLQVELLGMLLDEIQHQSRLKAEVRRTIGLVKATIRVLQGAVLAGLVASMTIPLWRDYFFVDLPHRALFITLFLMSCLASAFFEYRLATALKGEAF